MQPPLQHSWINLAELKSQIIRKLGRERSKQYFDYLNKFLNLKLSKVEFDKLLLTIVGRDGILLHNQLVRSILRNACTEKVAVANKKPLDGLYHQNGSGPIVTHASSQPVLPNGDVLLTSPRKARTGARERRGGDRRVGLGSNGKTINSSPSSSIPHSDDFNAPLDNGNATDTRTPTQHHQELMQQARNADGRVKPQEGKDKAGRISLHAPLGIPFYPGSVGGARRTPPIKAVGVSYTDSLLDTITLRARMEPVSATQGLQGVSLDSANALNNGLNAYLRGLIKSCCDLNGPVKSNPAHVWPVNGVIPIHEPKRPISLVDLRVAMELNPQQLGEDWPVLLEKICTHAYES